MRLWASQRHRTSGFVLNFQDLAEFLAPSRYSGMFVKWHELPKSWPKPSSDMGFLFYLGNSVYSYIIYIYNTLCITHLHLHIGISPQCFIVCFGLLRTFTKCLKGSYRNINISFLMMLKHRAKNIPKNSLFHWNFEERLLCSHLGCYESFLPLTFPLSWGCHW